MSDLSLPGSTPISTLTGDTVARVPADATLLDTARALTEGGLGAVVVGDEVPPAALVSERDVIRAIADGRDPATTLALDVASTDLIWCDAAATVDEVAAQMRDRYVRHILVEDGDACVGIVSARDLLGIYSADASLE
jgi:CBS domain-containing protein